MHAVCGDRIVRARGAEQRLVVPRGPCTLHIEPMNRYRTVVIENPPDTVVVELRPRLEVDVVTDVTLEEGTHLLVHLGEERAGGRIDAGETATRVHVGSTGRVPVSVSLRVPRYGERSVRGERRREVVGYDEFEVSPPGAVVEIADVEGVQSVTAPIDSERLAAARSAGR